MHWQQRQHKHQGKGEGDQRRTHLCHLTGAKFIGQTAGKRRGQRPGGPGDTETARYCAAHVIVFESITASVDQKALKAMESAP